MSTISPSQLRQLRLQAVRARQEVIRMIRAAGSGHPAGSLGMAEVMVALYARVLRHDPRRPDWKRRDRFLLSNGHICPIRYAVMAQVGYFPEAELMTLRRFGSRLQGHPERRRMPALESTSGPLGEGLAQAAGLAWVARTDRRSWHTFVLTSDGEHDAGLHWEAVMFAGREKLDNLTCIVDRNHIQIDGRTEDVMPLEPLTDKYLACGWQVDEVDGNDLTEVIGALERSRGRDGRPTCVVAHNMPGCGVSFMENDHRWHGRAPSDDEARRALEELREEEKRLTERL